MSIICLEESTPCAKTIEVRCKNTMDRRKRGQTIPPAISDYIVSKVMKNDDLLLRGCKSRMMKSNAIRKDLWNSIGCDIWSKFGMKLTGQQVQTHFNNRRKRVMTPDVIEKRYREKTGTGREEKLERLIHEARETLNDQDRDIYRYYSGTAAYKKDCIMETFKAPHSEKQEENLKDLDMEDQDDEDEEILIREPDQSKEGIIRIGKAIEMEKNKASACEVEVDEEVFNSDDKVRFPKRNSVSAAEIRLLQKEMLESEKKLFDTWTHMVVVHMNGIRELISSQRVILEEMMAFFKRCSTPGRPAEATTAAECVVICDPNIEPSLREGTIVSTIV